MRIARIAYEGKDWTAEAVEGGYLIRDGGARREVPADEARLLPPTLPSKILGVGWNFPEHIREMTAHLPADQVPQGPGDPPIFLKALSCLVGPGEAIIYPAEATRVDYEGELVAVIGSELRRADRETARAAVLGWSCGNDVTERDMQRRDKQWWRAKGFDTFGPVGPWLETETPDPDARIRTFVNGELRQVGQVRDMLRDPFEILAYVSQAMTLLPGDAVMLGTPPGVGPLQPGDVVRVAIDGIGVLENPVLAETREAAL